MNKAMSIADLAALAADTEDQTVDTVVSFDNEPPPAGITVGRFIEYIDLGKQKQPDYQGKPKPPADSLRLTFELLSPKKNLHEYEVDGEQRVRADRVSIRISKKLSDKAKFKKLFNAMTYGREGIKHMAQMLGEAFIINIYHNVVEKEGKKTTYVNLDKDGAYGISAPFKVDPLEGTREPVPVREPLSPLRLFLWNNPTQETWDSLFIDGTRTVKKDGGAEVEVSKNWMQELIMSAANFDGSLLQAMLGGVDGLPTDEVADDDSDEDISLDAQDEPEEEDDEEAKAAAEIAALQAKAAAAKKAKQDAAADKVVKVASKAVKPAEKAAGTKATKDAVKPKGAAVDALAELGLM